MKYGFCWLWVPLMAACAAGPAEQGTDALSSAGAGAAPGMAAWATPAPARELIPPACRGFSFEGIVHSPGGDALPNTCAPFHPTTNNPYAVRCVDVWPWFRTRFPGDDFCILPPPPDKGAQYGAHPQGKLWLEQVSRGDMSGYDAPAADFVMETGEEEQANYQTSLGNPMPANFYRTYIRMRGGSHHMIVTTEPGATASEAWGPPSTAGLLSGSTLPGAQRPDENAPMSLPKPAEDAGLYTVLPASAVITLNMHHFNVTGQAILKEVWANLWWETDARIEAHTIFGLELGQTVSLAIEPGGTRDLHYSWTIAEPTRILFAFGHRHAWTSNFSAWVEQPGAAQDILYQSFHWLDEPTYRYDSETLNPVPAPDTRADGGHSGSRTLLPGEKLHFNCHVEFTEERALQEHAPSPSTLGTLRFANEAFTAEMCVLFGSSAGVKLPPPSVDPTPIPAFATVD